MRVQQGSVASHTGRNLPGRSARSCSSTATGFRLEFGLAFEVDLAEQVAAIFTLDGTLSRSKKSSFVFRAEYSHFRSSLQRRVTVQVVLGTKHDMVVGGDTDLQMKIIGERFADTRID